MMNHDYSIRLNDCCIKVFLFVYTGQNMGRGRGMALLVPFSPMPVIL